MAHGSHLYVGVAFPRSADRDEVTEWLRGAEMEVETLVEACRVDSDVAGRGLGCVVADGSLLKSGYLENLRKRDGRLPIVAVVAAGEERDPQLARPGVTIVSRPLEASALTLAVSLAYSDGRQARRGIRKQAPRLPSRASGVSAEILDVSPEGLRLELPRAQVSKLGPVFRVQVPMVALDVAVKRVWVGRAHGDRVQCGAVLVEVSPAQRMAWDRVIELAAAVPSAPAASMRPTRRDRTVTLPPPDTRLLARVSTFLNQPVRVGAWASQLTRGRA